MTSQLPNRKIGTFNVSAIGMGCMPASWGTDPQMRINGIAAIHAALDHGITFLDTADIYAPSWNTLGHNEKLVAEALRTYTGKGDLAKVVVATKGGITRKPGPTGGTVNKGPAGETFGRNATLDYLLRAVEASAGRLGVDKIDLWQHHRMDPSMTFEKQFDNVLMLREQGLVKHIGLSNVNADMLKHAIKVGGSVAEGGIVSVQNERSPRYRQWSDVFELCTEHGIAFLPWSPLGGKRFFEQLPTRFATIDQIATDRGVSPYVVTLAWHLKSASNVIPIPGASSAASIIDSASAATFDLSDQEFASIEASLGESDELHEELLDLPSVY